MTIEQFLSELEKIKPHFDWKLFGLRRQLIRGIPKEGAGPHFCPIVAVAHITKKPYLHNLGWYAARDLNINALDALQIMIAADEPEKNTILRQKMSKTLNLKEHTV